MINAYTWQDIYYETTAEELVYSVRYLGNDIFYGRAVKSPSSATLRINVSKICRDWVEAQAPSFSDGIYQGMNYGVFDLLNDEGTILSQYGFLFNWGYEDVWDGLSFVMSKPINGRADSRMIMLYSVFSDTTGQTICRDEEFIKKLRIIPSYIEVSNTGVTRTITVESNYDYSVTVDEPWLHISPLSGTKGKTVFTITVDENALAQERYGTIHFDDSILTVLQKAAPKYLEVNPTEFNFGSSASSSTFTVSTNYDYTLSTDVPWITISANSGSAGNTTFTITVGENLGNRRGGHILIDGKPAISVNQSKYSYFVITPSELTYGYEPDSQQITITANTDYDITTNVPWIHISQNSGESGVTVITVTVDRNTVETGRNGIIRIGDETVQVYQSKFVPYLNVDPPSIVFYKEGGISYITITANTRYNISASVPWITLSQNYVESGVTTIAVTSSQYDTGKKRNGTITVGNNPVEVVQYSSSVSDYLTMDILEDGYVKIWGYIQNPTPYEYSLNGGDWITASGQSFEVKAGDKVRIKGTMGGRCNPIDCEDCPPECLPPYSSDTEQHLILNDPLDLYGTYVRYNLYGNVLSLKYGDAFTGTTGSDDDIEIAYSFYGTNVLDASGLLLPEKRFCAAYAFAYSHITDLPEIPSVAGDLKYMFANSWIENADIKLAPSNQDYLYYGMFKDCIYLIGNPEIDINNVMPSGCTEMFMGCRNLTGVTVEIRGIVSEMGLSDMFNGCSSLESIGGSLNITDIGYYGCESMFSGCTSLSVMQDFSFGLVGRYGCLRMFSNTGLVSTPNISADTIVEGAMAGLFSDCKSLKSATTISVADISSAPECFAEMYKGCTSLVSAPYTLLPWTSISTMCYMDMFSGCTSLVSAPRLPAATLTTACYMGMFEGCYSLTDAPWLNAAVLQRNCYASMFNGCSSLNDITCLATTNVKTETAGGSSWALNNWVNGVAENGIFSLRSGVSWNNGVSGIPTGWRKSYVG